MGLAYIGRITEINPIEGADFIVSAEVICGSGGKWRGTVKKDEFAVGDLAEVYLQDALLPDTPQFNFMAKNSFIVRMRRFKGVPSECLILPVEIPASFITVGMDIAERKGVTKYDKPLPLSMTGLAIGSFPPFIPKTDEPLFQTVPWMVNYMRGAIYGGGASTEDNIVGFGEGRKFYSTVKADGSSATVFKYQGHFGCCSRNLELKEVQGNAIWALARKYDLENKLMDGIAIQFETVGPGIQGNPMGLKEVDARVFNIYDIEEHRYFDAEYVFKTCKAIEIPTVQVLDWDATFNFPDDESIRKYAEGLYPNGKQREGVVIRPMFEERIGNQRISFKSINLNYKG